LAFVPLYDSTILLHAVTSNMASSAWKIIPQFKSASIEKTIDFYTNKLHFEVGGVTSNADGHEAHFCSLYMGANAEANIYFAKSSDSNGEAQGLGVAMIAMGTSQLDEYYSLLQGEADITIVEPIEDKALGYRQFSVRDPDRNRLVFFRFLEGGNPGGPGNLDLSKAGRRREQESVES
jgi:hypothetical protein